LLAKESAQTLGGRDEASEGFQGTSSNDGKSNLSFAKSGETPGGESEASEPGEKRGGHCNGKKGILI